MFISKFVNWLTEKNLLHQSRRWRREKLVHLFEEANISDQPKQQSQVKNATVDSSITKPRNIKHKNK